MKSKDNRALVILNAVEELKTVNIDSLLCPE